MKTISMVFFLFFAFGISQQAFSMHFCKQHKGKLVFFAMCTAGVLHDYYKGQRLAFVDVSTPREPTNIDALIDKEFYRETETLALSVTRNQLINDIILTNGPVFYAKSKLSKEYNDIVDAVLFSHFYIFDPTLRRMLTNMVVQLSFEEAQQLEERNLSMVHGTGNGASILLRTIFDEVLNDNVHHHHLKLRDDDVLEKLRKYPDAYSYYDEQYALAPVIKKTMRFPGCGTMPTNEEVVLFDKGPARDYLLSANFGFFGQSSWLIHGFKESSAEFVTCRCSFLYQALSMLSCLQITDPGSFLMMVVGLALNIAQNPIALKNPSILFDSTLKGFDDSEIFKKIFISHGAGKLYSHYQKELTKMQTVASAGLIHLFIPIEEAKDWCYVSKPLGICASRNPDSIVNLAMTHGTELPWNQTRIVLHPELCQKAKMRFYLLGEPKKIATMIDRMYVIAHEIKASQKE